jgi:hypothetical protein
VKKVLLKIWQDLSRQAVQTVVFISCTMQVRSRILSWSHVKLNDLDLIKGQFKQFFLLLF